MGYVGDVCVEFLYYMHGDNVNRLSLFIEKTKDIRENLWEREGEQASGWLQAHVDITLEYPWQTVCYLHTFIYIHGIHDEHVNKPFDKKL